MSVMKIRYWRRRSRLGYERLDGSTNKSNSDPTSRKRVRLIWRRIKIVPKLRVLRTTSSPKKLLTRLRDSYVNMMLRLANSQAMGSSSFGYGSGLAKKKEYDEKKLVEIYKSMLMAQGTHLVHPNVPKLSSESIVISPLR